MGSASLNISLTNHDLFTEIQNSAFSCKKYTTEAAACLYKFLRDKMGNNWIEEEWFEKEIDTKITAFYSNISRRWNAVGVRGIRTKFLQKNQNWLQLQFSLPNTSSNLLLNINFF